ncbi:MAG TPA: biliverdin-producing heme oxygenase [Tepidiformaceae bacterium]|mgnify:CR=1 FL=1|nr:biliverdin-producing heme oxygenase [Tepidiformaceae bacterium]
MSAAAIQAGFSEELRKATGRSHGDAQHSPFMSALFAGGLSRERYANLVAQYYFIYGALEERARSFGGDSAVPPFTDGRLERLPAIEADLRHFLGAGWRSEVRPVVTTLEYVGRILGATPNGFVAHHYVRYMGDLSGGQHIAKVIARQFSLDSAGLAFYDFSELGDLDAFKQAYRAKLDSAGWDSAARQEVIEEALLAYDLNTRLLQEL